MKPLQYFSDIWERCKELKVLHAHLSSTTTAVLPVDELLRAEWVSRVGALDLYVHELVAQNMVRIFDGNRSISSGFSKFHCSSDALIRIKSAATASDASAAFDLEVRTKLSRRTFQLPEDIADGIRLVSSAELWNEVAVASGAIELNKNTIAKNLKKSLSLIVERRNKIAHEGDLQRSVPRVPWPISRADVEYVEKFIEDLVRKIDKIVEQH